MTSDLTVTAMEPMDFHEASRFKFGLYKTPPGLLKLLQAAVAAVCIGLLATMTPVLTLFYPQFFAILGLNLFASLITTFLLLVSYIVSPSAASVLQKTLFELLYHGVSSVLYAVTAATILIGLIAMGSSGEFKYMLSIEILCLMNTLLYSLGAYCNFRAMKSS